MYKYIAYLIDETGCNFDNEIFKTLFDARKWACGRDGCYTLKINKIDDDTGFCKFYKIKSKPKQKWK